MDAELIHRLEDVHLRAATPDDQRTIMDAIAALSATPQAETALRDLHAVVIEQNRLGASWHAELFGRLMNALANAKHVLEDAPQAAQVPDHVRKLVGRIDCYRLRMSYNESYFGEPAGLLKGVISELASAVNAIYPSGNTTIYANTLAAAQAQGVGRG